MTNLINQAIINEQTTTFLNYVNSLEGGQSCGKSGIVSLITTQLGTIGTRWNTGSSNSVFDIRFPAPWETFTGSISTNLSFRVSDNSRVLAVFIDGAVNMSLLNSANTQNAGSTKIGTYLSRSINASYSFYFGCINNYSMAVAVFNSIARTTCYWQYVGWLKNPQFATSSGLFPRNCVWVDSADYRIRVATENTTNSQTPLSQNPSLSCSVTTPGANSTDVIWQDSVSPNNYIGQLWNMMILPSSAQVGKIYKNTGVDPDTGIVETDQKAFWMCVGSWGTDKIGMRVWTEGIT